MTRGEYFIQYYFLERYFSILSKSEGRGYRGVGSSSSSGGNSGSSSGSNYSREISCSESVLWTTNCPLILACTGLGDSGHFLRSLYTFRIQSVFLLFIKYTHDYPHAEGKELSLERSF